MKPPPQKPLQTRRSGYTYPDRRVYSFTEQHSKKHAPISYPTTHNLIWTTGQPDREELLQLAPLYHEFNPPRRPTTEDEMEKYAKPQTGLIPPKRSNGQPGTASRFPTMCKRSNDMKSFLIQVDNQDDADQLIETISESGIKTLVTPSRKPDTRPDEDLINDAADLYRMDLPDLLNPGQELIQWDTLTEELRTSFATRFVTEVSENHDLYAIPSLSLIHPDELQPYLREKRLSDLAEKCP